MNQDSEVLSSGGMPAEFEDDQSPDIGISKPSELIKGKTAQKKDRKEPVNGNSVSKLDALRASKKLLQTKESMLNESLSVKKMEKSNAELLSKSIIFKAQMEKHMESLG